MLLIRKRNSQFVNCRSKGFTLLEVMVALVIFATAAVALSKSLSESANNVGEIEQRQFADLVARAQIEIQVADQGQSRGKTLPLRAVGVLGELVVGRTVGVETRRAVDEWRAQAGLVDHFNEPVFL